MKTACLPMWNASATGGDGGIEFTPQFVRGLTPEGRKWDCLTSSRPASCRAPTYFSDSPRMLPAFPIVRSCRNRFCRIHLTAQQELLDLAGRGFRNRAEHHGLGRLEAWHLGPAKRDDLGFSRPRVFL